MPRNYQIVASVSIMKRLTDTTTHANTSEEVRHFSKAIRQIQLMNADIIKRLKSHETFYIRAERESEVSARIR